MMQRYVALLAYQSAGDERGQQPQLRVLQLAHPAEAAQQVRERGQRLRTACLREQGVRHTNGHVIHSPKTRLFVWCSVEM